MKTFLVASLAFLASLAAAADTNDAAVGITIACRPELRGVCKPKRGLSPLQCLMDHKGEVSSPCARALDASKGASVPSGGKPASGHAYSCMGEFEKVCKGVKSKELSACLKKRRGELSEFCRKIADSAGNKSR